MRIGVLTGGGDCPGLNAVIRATVRKAEREFGSHVLGIRDGWRGVIERDFVLLDVERMRGTLPRGGTIIGSSRTNPGLLAEGLPGTVRALEEMELDALIVVGGDGTLGVANRVSQLGFPIVAVPKTIDNDIWGTEFTFGFNTAVQIATDAIDRLHTTAESHDRVMVVEVMGRHVGHVAVHAGIAGGAAVTLIPEYPFDIQEVCERLVRRHGRGRYASIIVVAEGAVPTPGTIELPDLGVDQWGNPRLGGIGAIVAAEIEARTGFESRVTVLGHVQRGGTPTAYDRVLATRYGIAAVDAVHDGDFGMMVALQSDRIVRVPLSEIAGKSKCVGPEIYEDVARYFFA